MLTLSDERTSRLECLGDELYEAWAAGMMNDEARLQAHLHSMYITIGQMLRGGC